MNVMKPLVELAQVEPFIIRVIIFRFASKCLNNDLPVAAKTSSDIQLQ